MTSGDISVVVEVKVNYTGLSPANAERLNAEIQRICAASRRRTLRPRVDRIALVNESVYFADPSAPGAQFVPLIIASESVVPRGIARRAEDRMRRNQSTIAGATMAAGYTPIAVGYDDQSGEEFER